MRAAVRIVHLATTLCLICVKGGGGIRELPKVWWQPGTAVEEGDTVELQCQVSSEAAGPAIWLKLDPSDPNSHVLLSHGDLLITEDRRFSVLHRPQPNVYVVKIRHVSAGDAGSYQCQVPVSGEEEELRVEAAPPVVVTLLTDNAHSFACPTPAPTATFTLTLATLSLLAGLVAR